MNRRRDRYETRPVAATSSYQQSVSEEQMAERLKILHLEDNPDDAELVRVMIARELGYCDFSHVDNRKEFITALDEAHYDLVLADYVLPGFDGLAALEIHRQKCPEVPFILVSGSIGEERAIEALTSGITDYVMKEHLQRLGPAARRALQEARIRVEHRDAEMALRRSEKLLRGFFDAGLIGMAIRLPGNGLIQVNDKYCEIMGYPRAELEHMRWEDYTHPDDLELGKEERSRIEAGEIDSYSLDKRYVRKDGSVVHVNMCNECIRRDDGAVEYCIVTVQDITWRKQAEAALQVRIRQQEAVVELGRTALIGTRLDVLIEEAIKCVTETLAVDFVGLLELLPGGTYMLMRAGSGWSDGVVGHAKIPVVQGTPAGFALRAMQPVTFTDLGNDTRFPRATLLREHGVSSGAGVVVRGQGEAWGVLAAHTRRLRDFTNEDINFLQVIANVLAEAIDSRQAEADLRRSEAKFRRLLESSPDGMVIVNATGEIDTVNAQIEQMTGYKRQELIGQPVEILVPDRFTDEHRRSRQDYCTQPRIRTMGEPGMELFVRCKDGSEFPAEISLNPLVTEQGMIVAVDIRDITERKQVEQALLKSEALLRRYYDAGLVGMSISTPQKGWIQINETFCQMVGYPRDELMAMTWADITHPDDLPKDLELFDRVLAGDVDGYTVDKRYIRKNGQTVYVTVSIKCARKGDGSVDYIVAFIQDISSRKQAEEVLRKSESQLRDAQRMARLGFWEYDLIRKELYWSDELYEMIGVEREELTITHDAVLNLVHPEDQEEYKLLQENLFKNHQSFNIEHRIIIANGEIRFHHSMAELIRDDHGNPTRILGTVMDITDRKRAEIALRQARDELELRVAERTAELRESKQQAEAVSAIADTTLENMDQGILMVNADNRILIYNDKLSEYTGIPCETAMACPSFEEYLKLGIEWFGEDGFQRAQELGKTKVKVNYEVTTKNGQILEVRQNPLQTGGFVRTYTDITQIKNIQADLEYAKEKAEAASIAKANFLATMSHEIRTPMNGVIGMTDLLLQTSLDNDQRQMLRTINDSGQSLLTIINDILDFSKIEAGKLKLEYITMSLADVVEGSVQTLIYNAERKGLRLITYVDPMLPEHVQGDPVRIRQVMINLCGNAIKFTDKGQVMVRADRLVNDSEEDVVIRFSVIDEGIGIPEEVQRKLFQEFTQAESSTTRQFGGTGLGLSICQRLTEMMGGEIGVNSRPGAGSEFYFTLTFKPARKEHRGEQQSDFRGVRILLIVPDEDECEIYRRYLEHWHAEVVTEHEISYCLELYQAANSTSTPFDIVIFGSQWSREEQFATCDSVTGNTALAETRFVSLHRGRRRQPRLENDVCVSLDTDLMRRSTFLTAVSIAAGRDSPEVETSGQLEELQRIESGRAPDSTAPDLLILVAEDNPTNRDVIQRQLKLLGYACDMADDGRQALEFWRNRDYDLLLTDCQMPVMDGFALTRAIRDEEEEGIRLPIIAITANVLQGEAERCLAAGMDDYLGKPVNIRELREKLQQSLPQKKPAIVKNISEPPKIIKNKKADHACPVDERALKNLLGDDPIVYREILKNFIDPSRRIIWEIQAGWKDRCAEDIRKGAHKLKSSARSIGANKLADLCLDLENAGQKEDWQVIEKEMPFLDRLMADVEDYITKL